MPSATVVQIRRANAWVRRAHQFADLKLTFLSIPPEKLRLVTHTDNSSKDQDGTGRTQGGYIIGATDPSMGPGRVAPWSPLVWEPHNLKQGCTSTLAGEAKALSLGLGHVEWSCACLPLFCSPNFKTDCQSTQRVSLSRAKECVTVQPVFSNLKWLRFDQLHCLPGKSANFPAGITWSTFQCLLWLVWRVLHLCLSLPDVTIRSSFARFVLENAQPREVIASTSPSVVIRISRVPFVSLGFHE